MLSVLADPKAQALHEETKVVHAPIGKINAASIKNPVEQIPGVKECGWTKDTCGFDEDRLKLLEQDKKAQALTNHMRDIVNKVRNVYAG